MKVFVIGAGNMGRALVAGMQAASASGFDLWVYDPYAAKFQELAEQYHVQVCHDLLQQDLKDSYIVLCVKPHDLPELARQLKPSLGSVRGVFSILAGVCTDSLREALGFDGALVRAMPNIAATVGCAATAMVSSPQSAPEVCQVAEQVFGCFGECYWVKESYMDAVTGLSGSGPAYVYMTIEAMTDGGVRNGLPVELARRLATQTVLGAATLVKHSGLHPAVLKDQVTTPGGTTISAVAELENHGLRAMFSSAILAATERSRELGKKKPRS